MTDKPKIKIYNDENLIEMIEMYASLQGYISSEEELSEKYDKEIMPILIKRHGVKGELFNNTAMINEKFNNWAEWLCKKGEIHPEQYENYEYIGKWAYI
jgi:hypothetical protein